MSQINKEKFIDTIINSSTGETFSVQSGIIKGTYEELKALRDEAKLIPGAQYRMTDYVTTCDQENCRSAMHPFDLILTADSNNQFNENVTACSHEGETYFYKTKLTSIASVFYTINEDDELCYDGFGEAHSGDVILEGDYKDDNPILYKNDVLKFPDLDTEEYFNYIDEFEFDNVLYDRWQKIETNNPTNYYILTNKLVDSNNLKFIEDVHTQVIFEYDMPSTWKIKYCFDNDVNRFVWARTKENEATPACLYIKDSRYNPIYGPFLRHPEWDNHIPYQGLEPVYIWADLTPDEKTGYYSIVITDTETLTIDDEIEKLQVEIPVDTTGNWQASIIDSVSMVITAYHEEEPSEPVGRGVIYDLIDEHNNHLPYDFKNIQFKRFRITSQGHTEGWDKNELEGSYVACMEDYIHNFLDSSYHIIPGDYLWCYTFHDLENNKDWTQEDIGIICNNTILPLHKNHKSTYIPNNVFFDYYTYDNVIANNSKYNTFNNRCYNNTIGNYFCWNILNASVEHNRILDTFTGNVCINPIEKNLILNDFTDNRVASGMISNIIYNSCTENLFIYTGSAIQENYIGYNFSNNTIKADFYSNTILDQFENNVINSNFICNNIGIDCQDNTFNNLFRYNVLDNLIYRNEFNSSISYCHFESNIYDVIFKSSNSTEIKNKTVKTGIQGTSDSNKKVVSLEGGDTNITYKPANSSEVVVQ